MKGRLGNKRVMKCIFCLKSERIYIDFIVFSVVIITTLMRTLIHLDLFLDINWDYKTLHQNNKITKQSKTSVKI